jgi:hypothetical protein
MKSVLFMAAIVAITSAPFIPAAYAQQPQPEHVIEHNPVSTITPGDRGEMPHIGPYKESEHSAFMRGITESVSVEGCDRMARKFVATVNLMAFIRECWASHHRLLTHVPPAKP